MTTTRNRSPIREIATYLSITYGVALAIALALPDANINKLLSIFAPTIAVCVITFTMFGKGERRSLWGTLGLRRVGFRTWPAALLLPFLLCGGAYGAALVIGAGDWVGADVSLAAVPDWIINLVVSLAIMTVVILGEEIGWRGFMLPRVQELTSRRRAAVVTGFAHGLFHLPLICIASTYDTGGSRWIAAPAAVAVITAGGVFYAWLRDRSGSIWPVAIGHNAVNTVFDIGASLVVASSPASLTYVAGETGFATLGACVVMAVVMLARARVWHTPVVPTQPAASPAQAGRKPQRVA
jgi:membrane protease YdiL (CAAX protease family)